MPVLKREQGWVGEGRAGVRGVWVCVVREGGGPKPWPPCFFFSLSPRSLTPPPPRKKRTEPPAGPGPGRPPTPAGGRPGGSGGRGRRTLGSRSWRRRPGPEGEGKGRVRAPPAVSVEEEEKGERRIRPAAPAGAATPHQSPLTGMRSRTSTQVSSRSWTVVWCGEWRGKGRERVRPRGGADALEGKSHAGPPGEGCGGADCGGLCVGVWSVAMPHTAPPPNWAPAPWAAGCRPAEEAHTARALTNCSLFSPSLSALTCSAVKSDRLSLRRV